MSTLTKIFIVLLVVFCIAFTMSTISFVAQTTDWRQLAQGYQQEAHAADTYLRNALASSAAQIAQDRDIINAHISRIADLQQANDGAARRNAEYKAELAEARGQIKSLQAAVRQLAGELKLGQEGWAEQRRQRDDLERRNVELEKRNLDLNERVNEQTAMLVVADQKARQLEQQIHILREENTKLSNIQRRMAAGDFEAAGDLGPASVTAITPAAGSPIRGRITELAGSLATLSVGSADGVAENMVFVIYRGREYIGDLKVIKVEPERSAGRVVRSRSAPRLGDVVADAAGFASGS